MRNRRRSSFTAEAAAAARAYGALEPDPGRRCGDDLAIRFVGPLFRFFLLPGVRRGFVEEYERRAPGVFFHHVARTKHIDALFSSAIDAGAKQFVFLGAGFDSRAYRFAERLRSAGARAFEVDHPATSAVKRKRIKRIFGAAPAHVTYVPVSFLTERIEDRLLATGYDPALVTFFVWEGVTPYLDEAAVDATLAIVSRAAKGSGIVFDYVSKEALLHPDESLKKQMAAGVKYGEPYGFGVDQGDVGALVGKHGLRVEENLSAKELGGRYLVG
ncbi:MAG TPA: SAM-dependent methyltransferase, partial [Polyangiaceae bacterium]